MLLARGRNLHDVPVARDSAASMQAAPEQPGTSFALTSGQSPPAAEFRMPSIPRFKAWAVFSIALSGCAGILSAEPVYYEAEYVPPYIETYPHAVYDGRVVYQVDDRFYYRRGPGWVYYYDSPAPVHQYQAYRAPRARVYEAAPSRPRERVYEAAPSRPRERVYEAAPSRPRERYSSHARKREHDKDHDDDGHDSERRAVRVR
jgi:hypothetical protein